MDNDALRMIAKQQEIKNVLTAIKLQSAIHKFQAPEQYEEIVKSIALDDSVNSMMNDNLDFLYQIANQLRIENIIDALAFLISRTQVPAEEYEYRQKLENIINSYGKEKEKKQII